MDTTARAIVPSPRPVALSPRPSFEQALARIRGFLEDRRMSVEKERGSFAAFEKDLRFVLKEEPEGVEHVIRSLVYLRKKHPRKERVAKELAYFRKQRHRMRYHQFVAQGFPIGSGEAACKTLVTQRMKQSGMRWREGGGQAILTVRGWTQSGDRFDRAWALLATTYQAEVVVLHNVVPFPPGGRRRSR